MVVVVVVSHSLGDVCLHPYARALHVTLDHDIPPRAAEGHIYGGAVRMWQALDAARKTPLHVALRELVARARAGSHIELQVGALHDRILVLLCVACVEQSAMHGGSLYARPNASSNV
jgi:hypothetical protein